MKLNIRQKIVLLVLAFLVPAVVCLVLLSAERGETIEQNRRERWGIEYLRPLRQLRERLPQLERAMAAARRGEAGASARATQQWEGLQQVRAHLNDVDLRLGGPLATTEDLMQLDQKFKPLAKTDGDLDPRHFTEVERHTGMLTTLVGDSSGLILDSSLDSFYLAKALVADLPGCQERLRRLLGLLEPGGQGTEAAGEQRDQILVQVALLKKDLSVIEDDYRVAAADNAALRSALELPATQAVARARSVANLFEPGSVRTLQAAAAAVPGALDASFQLYDGTLTALDKLLHERIDQDTKDRSLVAILMLLGLLPGLGIAAWLAYSSRPGARPALPSPEATDGPAGSGFEEARHRRLAHENQRLKALVADLVLEARSGAVDGAQEG